MYAAPGAEAILVEASRTLTVSIRGTCSHLFANVVPFIFKKRLEHIKRIDFDRNPTRKLLGVFRLKEDQTEALLCLGFSREGS